MKAKVLTPVLVVVMFLMSLSIYGQNNDVIVYDNVVDCGTYVKKEFVKVDKTSLYPISKRVHIYDGAGERVEATEYYVWASNGWKVVKKYEYEYDRDDVLLSMLCSKWDNFKRRWSNEVELTTYSYNDNGELADINVVKNKIDSRLITELR
jgi:hypothetical protein